MFVAIWVATCKQSEDASFKSLTFPLAHTLRFIAPGTGRLSCFALATFVYIIILYIYTYVLPVYSLSLHGNACGKACGNACYSNIPLEISRQQATPTMHFVVQTFEPNSVQRGPVERFARLVTVCVLPEGNPVSHLAQMFQC